MQQLQLKYYQKKVIKLSAQPKTIGLTKKTSNTPALLRGCCPVTDKLSVLSESRHARRMRSHYYSTTTSTTK